MGEGKTLRLREYREGRGFTQDQAIAAIKSRAKERGDVEPGLDQTAFSKHENGHRRPGLRYQALYCEVYRATAVELGFRLALPDESGHPDDVDRREFLTGMVGFAASLTLPVPTQLGSSDIVSLRASVAHLYRLDDLHGAGSVYSATARLFQRLHTFVEHASYNQATGRALRELTGLTAEHAGWLASDANRDDDAERWWLEAMKWGQRAESDSVSIVVMASMALQASDQRRPREVLDLAMTAQRTAGRASQRLTSVLLAREAQGHAGVGDTSRAHATLRRARNLADQPRHDDDPAWLAFYGPANFAAHEHRVALLLGDFAEAEDAARTALALNDPLAYPRTHALYLTYLADILVERHELDEAAAVAEQATVAAQGLDSPRVTRQLHAVTQSLDQLKDDPTASTSSRRRYAPPRRGDTFLRPV